MSNPIDLGATADADPAESVEQERAAVGEQPDIGGLVTPDYAQSAPQTPDRPAD